MRTCISCGRKARKSELVRIVRTPDGTICVDRPGRSAGRGAYVCSVACLEQAAKSGRLSRALKATLSQDEARGLIAAYQQLDEQHDMQHEEAAER